MTGSTQRLEIVRVRGGVHAPVADDVAVEEPLEIRVVASDAEEPVLAAVTMRTPGHDFELAVGFLFTEGIVPAATAVDRVTYCVDGFVEQQYNVVNVYLRPGVAYDPARLARNFYVTSSCGVCGKASLEALRAQGCRAVCAVPPVSDVVLQSLPAQLRRSQETFDATGGLHAAGWFTRDGELVVVREDVGRHNAVDKLIGERLLAGEVPLYDGILLVSGRASYEITQKAAMAGVPIVAAVGAPSSLAVATAQEFGMTLVGFLRGGGFNVYAGGGR